jgi:hypothetical protein
MTAWRFVYGHKIKVSAFASQLLKFSSSRDIVKLGTMSDAPHILERKKKRIVSSMSTMEAYVPSHPGLFEVDFREGYYCSALIARKVRL